MTTRNPTYDPATGLFYGAKGAVIGGKNKNGYVYVRMGGKAVLAHRLAWKVVHGAWPASDIDHINGNRSDNRISNLREASRSQNLANAATKRNGLKGVYVHVDPERTKRFGAAIWENYKRHWLGWHLTEEEAHAAYMRAAKELRGEFASDGRR